MDFPSAWQAAITATLGGVMGHDMRTQGDDGCFFFEPKLTVVISHRQDHGSVAGAQVREQWTAEN